MATLIDLIGKRFGRWTVVGRSPHNSGSHARWDCVCDCGNSKSVRSCSLRNGDSTSCGCLAVDARTKHGKKGTYQYQTYRGVRRRCYDKKHVSYKNYGGRGIKMYYRWKDDPKAFCDWLDRFLGPRPEGHSLDRINNDGDYEPRNLRWADVSTQLKNRRKRSS